ncbi:MAG: YdhR family protein [Deltaproteobacteria bacterium]|nr:YdhR family protein [Deltaproteobacteria bacterium]
MQNPLMLVLRAIGLGLSGKARFIRNLQNESIKDEGECFTAFRKVVVKPNSKQPSNPGAIFQVRFRFKNLSATANRLLSLIPIPLIVAQPGFRSKTWLLGEDSGDFIGYYEFDTIEAAEAYWNSLPLRMMRKRAAKGSLTHEIRS